MKWTCALLACLALLPAAAATGSDRAPPSCPPTLANELADTGTASQLVTVASLRPSSQTGALRVWEKRGDCWTRVAGPWQAWLGIRGISERKREGDLKTPSGAFGIQPVMFGVGPNPGVRYRYHRARLRRLVGRGSALALLQPLPSRPLRLEAALPHHQRGHVQVARVVSPPGGDRLQHAPGRARPGSGIFLHVSHGNATLGCVAVPLPQLVWLLRWFDPASRPLIVIGTRKAIRKF